MNHLSPAPAISDGSPPPDEPWRDLEAGAAEPAFSAARPWLRAALERLPEKRRPRLIAAYDENRTLISLCGIAPALCAGGVHIATTRWTSFFCHGVPLIAGKDPHAATRALLSALREAGAQVAEFPSIPAAGPFAQALRALSHRGEIRLAVMDTWHRAMLDATQAEEDWWRGQLRRRRRKEWQRLQRRLAERGETRFETLPPDAPLDPWLDDFLLLEASGWKGRAGTALASDPALAAFVRHALAGLHAEKRLRFWRLRHRGRTIASLFGMRHGRSLLLGKIAYDESMGAFSPGGLVTLHATRSLLADPAIEMADSCAVPDHPMIDHIWKQRLAMADFLVTLPGADPRLAGWLSRMEHARHQARGWLKQVWRGLRQTLRRRGQT
jgi:CelD/BcsL family acetyltransferase involved in cellulose biosynthesis